MMAGNRLKLTSAQSTTIMVTPNPWQLVIKTGLRYSLVVHLSLVVGVFSVITTSTKMCHL